MNGWYKHEIWGKFQTKFLSARIWLVFGVLFLVVDYTCLTEAHRGESLRNFQVRWGNVIVKDDPKEFNPT